MLWEVLVSRCGIVFSAALALLSILIWTIGIGTMLGLVRRDARPSSRALEVLGRLGGLSTQVGLLGSVVGMLIAFQDSEVGTLDDTLGEALALSYWSTAVGIFNALIANVFAVLTTTLCKHAPEP
jgi:biopolymer transport protein ExbB/TolQ